MDHSDDLLARLSAVAAAFPHRWPAVPESQITRAEKALGFPLPPLFAALYTRVADGGWHPAGATGSDGELYPLETLVDDYQRNRDPEEETPTDTRSAQALPEWPEGVVEIMNGGRFASLCLDCLDPAAPILVRDVDIAESDSDVAWTVLAPSLADWLEDALRGAEQAQDRSMCPAGANAAASRAEPA
ncbi:SMI1/KNR4 family protein [Streptomyces hydrogenans]|uniref:SMI1/KNR4 family protein n=1 Tax=Streptomyces hydrogenans TaxID=1873719 RepID=UPI0035E24BBF